METKKARGIAKRVVTKKINEITDLMTDENNADEVSEKTNELKEAVSKFQAAHRTFHSQLTEREAIEESRLYHDSVFDQVEHVQESVDVWLAGIETTRLMNSFHMQLQVRPDDSKRSLFLLMRCLLIEGNALIKCRRSLKPEISSKYQIKGK